MVKEFNQRPDNNRGGSNAGPPRPFARGPPGGRGGFRGAKKVVVQPFKHKGVFLMQGGNDAILTKSLVAGESVYGEKRVSVEENSVKA